MPELRLFVPKHWDGTYDLSNVTEFGTIKHFGKCREREPGLTWQRYLWRIEDEFNSFEDYEIIEEREVSTK